jgi:hypothetical protein
MLEKPISERTAEAGMERPWEADGVSIVSDERLVVIPRNMIIAAKPDIPDA